MSELNLIGEPVTLPTSGLRTAHVGEEPLFRALVDLKEGDTITLQLDAPFLVVERVERDGKTMFPPKT